jgi:anaerobic sulfite reductase subunit B
MPADTAVGAASVGPSSNTLSRPMTPEPHRVVDCRREADDVVTLRLAPEGRGPLAFRAGQFNMLTAFGLGESAISMSSRCADTEWVEHTIRDVGAVTHSLCRADRGDLIGVRGPFGTDWGVENRAEGDVVVLAGGIGLAPLRGAIYQLLEPPRTGRVFVIAGARSPSQLIFHDDIETWAALGARVAVTVDVAEPGWNGHVGLVTSLLSWADFDPGSTSALVCGPEVMMRFVAVALVDRGIDPGRIKISLERNMQCGIGWCGHCQLGPLLVCRDGPVVTYDGVVPHLLRERER